MTAKTKDLKDEKNSLITVIKILEEDQKSNKSMAWNVVNKQENTSSGSQIKSGETEHSTNQLENNRYSILSDENDDNDVIITKTQGLDRPSIREGICIHDDNKATIAIHGQDGSYSDKDKRI